jgi:hypothetical protein
MVPSSTPLVPDDQLDERAFFARDLDEFKHANHEAEPPSRRGAQTVDRRAHIKIACSVPRGGSNWSRVSRWLGRFMVIRQKSLRQLWPHR